MLLDCDIRRTRSTHIRLMEDTVKTLGSILAGVAGDTATILRDPDDGERGWTVLEVVCHLRDFDEIFHGRARVMLEQDYPSLPWYDHEQLAVEQAYDGQDLDTVYAELVASRRSFVALFRSLSEEQWRRTGVHPERGRFTMYDALFQVGLHDALHLEQIGRILQQRRVRT